MKFLNYLATGIGFFILHSCGEGNPQKQNQPVQTMPVFEAKKGDFTGFKEIPTQIEGFQNIEIRAKISGYIQNIYVDEGQTVKKGDPLFKLETASLSQDAGAANSSVAAAKANVRAAELEVERIEPLVTKGVISSVQLSTAQAKLSQAEAQLLQAKSNYNSITANIGYTNIISPIDGIVGRINLKNGSLVGPTTQTPLTTVSNIEQVFAYFSLNERDYLELTKELSGNSILDKIQKLPKIELILADQSIFQEKGTIDAVTGSIDPSSGAIRFRALFKNANSTLLNGSSGLIRIPKQYNDVIAIPALSTIEQQGMKMVYTVQNGDTLKAQPIDVIDEINGMYVLKSGLTENDKVLANGVAKVRPGMVIKPNLISMDSLVNSFPTVFK